jgi:hypothetical protein
MGQNFHRNEPSLKDIIRDQVRINDEVGKKNSCHRQAPGELQCQDGQLHSTYTELAELQ